MIANLQLKYVFDLQRHKINDIIMELEWSIACTCIIIVNMCMVLIKL